MTEDPTKSQFWESRYRARDTGWDIGRPAPAFVNLLSGPDDPPPGRMIVLGGGRGHDAIFFARHGFTVTTVDFAPTAIAHAKEAAREAGVAMKFVQRDLFTLPSTYNHSYRYALEHTCFSAIPTEKRLEYVQLVRRLLSPQGLYIALFFTHGRPGGPPFGVSAEEIRELFSPYFAIEKLEPPEHSVEQRQGEELFALMRPLDSRQRA